MKIIQNNIDLFSKYIVKQAIDDKKIF